MSMCIVVYCVVGISRPNLLVTPGISLLPTFAFQSPRMKRTSLFGVNSRGLVSHHRMLEFQLLQH